MESHRATKMTTFISTSPVSLRGRMRTPSVCRRMVSTHQMCMRPTKSASLHTVAQALLPERICNQRLKNFLIGWADLVSLLLVGLTIMVGGVDPWRRVWGYSMGRNVLFTILITLTITFSITRFLVEGTCLVVGSRAFLIMSVIYCARWIWLLVRIAKPGSRTSKAFQVARALKEAKMIRLGTSKSPERLGQKELIIRRGTRVAPHGVPYWRGVEESKRFDDSTKTWMLRLVQQELHSDLLDYIGMTQFQKKIGMDGVDELYKTFYDLVMTVDIGHRDLVMDFSDFLSEFKGITKDTRQPQRVGAVDDGDLGDVARRVAADACYYVWHDDAEFRTERHIRSINECVEKAAQQYFW